MIRDHEKEGHFSLLPALLASIVILNMGISSSGVVGDYQPDGKKRQAVITGIGVVSPLGIGIDPFWTSLIAGETGVDEISLFDASSFPGRLAAEVKDFHPEHYLSKKTLRPLSRQSQMAAVGYLLALQDANLKPEELNGLTDVIIGSAEGSYALVEQQFANHPVLLTKYEKGLADPFTLLKGVIIGPMLAIARLSGAKGYTTTVSSACTSGVNAVGLAAQRIEDGRSRCAIAGGVDCPIFASMVTGFTEARITTTSNNPNDLKPYAIEPGTLWQKALASLLSKTQSTPEHVAREFTRGLVDGHRARRTTTIYSASTQVGKPGQPRLEARSRGKL